MIPTTTYYKYRSIENWKFLVDILLNKRLYAGAFADMNDPMEGQYYYVNGEVRGDVRTVINAQRTQWNICSLTPDVKSSLMWAYYASGHRGLAIGVELARGRNGDIRRGVTYDSQVYVQPDEAKGSLEEVAASILFRKQQPWRHEREYRVLTRRQHVRVKIVEVHLGALMSDADRRLVTDLVKLSVPDARILKTSRARLK